MADARTPATFYAYAAWAACLVPRDRLLVLNVFLRDEAPRLRAFLARHGLAAPAWRGNVRAAAKRARKGRARRTRGFGPYC